MNHLARTATFVVLSLFIVRAQSPRFEAASVKSCKSGLAPTVGGPKGGGGRGPVSSPVTLNLPCQPLRFLINLAYVISNARPADGGPEPLLEGGPGWIDSDRYQIVAKTADAVPRDVMNGPMLRALLEERFHLKLRRESRDVPAYVLTVAKGGLKLRPSDGTSCAVRDPSQPSLPPGDKPWCGLARGSKNARTIQTELPGGSMAQFAKALGLSGRIVRDKTGVTETFDFHFEYAADGADVSDVDSAPSLDAALAKLGLRLEPTKVRREFLIIDHIEKPSEN